MNLVIIRLTEALIIEVSSTANFTVECRKLVKVLEVFWCISLEIVSNDVIGTFS